MTLHDLWFLLLVLVGMNASAALGALLGTIEARRRSAEWRETMNLILNRQRERDE